MALYRGNRSSERRSASGDGAGLAGEKKQPASAGPAHVSSAALLHTLGIMRQAPVLIFIVNPMGRALHAALTLEERVFELCNAQSVGAAVENMALAATELGLGSLWICDTYFAIRSCANGWALMGNCSRRWPWDMRRRRLPPGREKAWQMQ